jgi:hypothetical protein
VRGIPPSSSSFGHICCQRAVATVVAIAASAAFVFGQGTPDPRSDAAAASSTQAPAAPQAQKPEKDVTPPPSGFTRWIDLQTATIQVRYRYIETSAGVVSARQGQDYGAVRARLKFDPRGRFSVTAGVATGNGFISGWNNMGLGTGEAVNAWYLKQLFVAVVPAKGVEASYGGLAFVRGECTEITSYDNDGYLLGARLSVKRPKDLFVDELTATMGYLGATTQSSLASRYRNLDRVNYRHLLAARHVTKWLRASADYTRLDGVSTMRAAATLQTPVMRVVDLVRYEEYRRMGATPAFGFAVYAERKLGQRVAAGIGYADIDPQYGGLNADRFNKGRRVYETASVRLTHELSASLFATQATHNAFAVSNQRRVDVLLTFNALATLQRASWFR